jgi:beta-glucosidase
VASVHGPNHAELAEVAQVYVRDELSSVTTPVMRLAAFEKIALLPGESKRVTLHIASTELSLWNGAMQRVVEPGRFTIMVGSSAEAIHLKGGFEVAAAAAGPN